MQANTRPLGHFRRPTAAIRSHKPPTFLPQGGSNPLHATLHRATSTVPPSQCHFSRKPRVMLGMGSPRDVPLFCEMRGRILGRRNPPVLPGEVAVGICSPIRAREPRPIWGPEGTLTAFLQSSAQHRMIRQGEAVRARRPASFIHSFIQGALVILVREAQRRRSASHDRHDALVRPHALLHFRRLQCSPGHHQHDQIRVPEDPHDLL